MTTGLVLALFALCLFLSAVYSGSETGFYSLSRARLEVDAAEGRRAARLVRYLTRDESLLLVTILIGNNLVLELATGFGDTLLGRAWPLPPGSRELVLTALMTPVVFLLGELVPKDLFRHRPHTLLGFTAPIVAFSRGLFLPLALPLRALAGGLERLAGLRPHAVEDALSREHAFELLEEGARHGTFGEHTERLARNVLALPNKSVTAVQIPWARVETVDAALDDAAQRAAVGGSEYSRVPVVEGGRVLGYVHQLDVLGHPDRPVRAHLRPLPVFEADLRVDRALSRFRRGGFRAALVGTPEAPLGWVTLKDLVEEIAGELAMW